MALSVLIIVVFGALAFRVAQLQVLSGDRYKHLSLRQTVHNVPLAAQRGTIFDRDGRDLALSVDLTAVYADPRHVADPIADAAALAPILGVSESFLETQLSDRSFEFRYLAHRVSDAVVARVRKLGLRGVGFMTEPARQYPAGTLAGSLIGEVANEPRWNTGLESLYQNILRGRPGELVVERDEQGQEIPNTATHQVDARRGSDVFLTLDEPLQWETEQALIDEVTATQARSGMAAVVDVSDGDVVSLASIEGATGSTPARPSSSTEPTRPLMDLFEPGSTNKLITLSTALERGIVTPDTQIDVPPSLRIGDAVYRDVDPHGDVRMSVTDILRQSSNVGTIEIAQHLTNDQLASALRAFGLGRRTTVEFPGQASGLLLPPDHYYATGLASTSIGYGVAVTAMQMLDAYVTIANGGVTRPPHLLEATVDADGKRHAAQLPAGRRVVSERTAHEMTDMLTGVVSAGTGSCAAIPGYTIAGKTGTAHKAVNGVYSDGTMASFIGYAPAAHPRYAAIVVLDEPTNQYGGTAAAPVFADVMQFALTHNGVAPDDTSNVQYDAARAAAAATGTSCTDPASAVRDAQAQAAAARAAEAQAAAARVTRPSGHGAGGKAAVTPPDSLPADTSQSG